MTQEQLLKLADAYGKFEKITHWSVSMRILKKGDFFQSLIDGRDCRTATANKIINWFDKNWPDGLQWPRDIQRPSGKEDAA